MGANYGEHDKRFTKIQFSNQLSKRQHKDSHHKWHSSLEGLNPNVTSFRKTSFKQPLGVPPLSALPDDKCLVWSLFLQISASPYET
ncbi:hypothetical protein ACTXT7_016471 [Hymenolepis weldensis]